MFNVTLIKKYTYEIAVKGYSKINSLGVTIKYETNNLALNLLSLLKSSMNVVDKQTKIVIDKVKLITKLSSDIAHSKVKIEAKASSKEKISVSLEHDKEKFIASLKSRERISNTLIDKVTLILSPQVGYYRKLVEFDSLTLAELDDLTLEDMDVIISSMNSSLENEGVVI